MPRVAMAGNETNWLPEWLPVPVREVRINSLSWLEPRYGIEP